MLQYFFLLDINTTSFYQMAVIYEWRVPTFSEFLQLVSSFDIVFFNLSTRQRQLSWNVYMKSWKKNQEIRFDVYHFYKSNYSTCVRKSVLQQSLVTCKYFPYETVPYATWLSRSGQKQSRGGQKQSRSGQLTFHRGLQSLRSGHINVFCKNIIRLENVITKDHKHYNLK